MEWSKYDFGIYNFDAIPYMKRIAEIVGQTILSMISGGFNIDNLHLVGFSLGGW